ncbi:sigma-E factor negative regulatory protein [Diaphorobacter ruginosibacter]|uniref:sigma-E factor negative regulatory protein n=1 Tax=Diaphorobacter ruginosibacter TaxID=1715720 RepID=UPI003340AB4B
MNGDIVKREQLSALADGELVSAQCAEAVAFADSDEGRAAWHEYHLIGDVLRSSELARPLSCDLVSRLRAQLAQEARPGQLARGEVEQIVVPAVHVAAAHAPQSAQPAADAANHDVFRWKMVAGFASLAAVATIGWNAYTGLTRSAVEPGMQLAAIPIASTPGGNQNVVAVSFPLQMAPGEPERRAVMIRDPRLDELLAAHKQYGSTSALQMPAGFLRNATFEAPAR